MSKSLIKELKSGEAGVPIQIGKRQASSNIRRAERKNSNTWERKRLEQAKFKVKRLKSSRENLNLSNSRRGASSRVIERHKINDGSKWWALWKC